MKKRAKIDQILLEHNRDRDLASGNLDPTMLDYELVAPPADSQTAIAVEDFDIALEMMYYDVFYRRRGIRRYQYFVVPKVYLLDTFELPKNSIIHYVPESDVELGISPNHLFLRKVTTMILSEHVTQMTSTEGDPIRTPISAQQLINQYRRNNRRIRLLRNYDTALREEKNVIVVNYALLNYLYRYRVTRKTKIFKFHNFMNTFIDKINEVAEIAPDHQQYIELRLPSVVPTRELLVRAAANFNLAIMDKFPDTQSLIILELWKWFGPNRETSLFNKLTPAAIKSLQMVWQESGRYCFLSMGLLNQWRKDENDPESKGVALPKQMQLGFIKFLNSLFEIRSIAAKSTIETTEVPVNDDNGDEENPDSETKAESVVIDGKELEELDRLEEAALNSDSDEVLDEETVEDNAATQFIPFEDPKADSEPPAEPTPLSDGVEIKATELLDLGLISPAEQRRYVKLGSAYKTIPDPFGSTKTLEEAAKVPMEVVNTIKEDQFRGSPVVLDPSMKKSSLQNFDKDYIEKVMKPDIISSVLSFNKAGVAVADYKVEKVIDPNSQYELHTVRLVPVGGSPSTFNFTVPIVNARGEFMDRGTKYRFRKQRADLPIRKIDSARVGLTTYYSKLFVDRSRKTADDYGKWLRNNLVLMAESGTLKNVSYDNVFNRTIKAPRPFTAISQFFKHFTVGEYSFIWDYDELTTTLGEQVVKNHLKDGEIPCAKRRDGAILIMSQGGTMYVSGTSRVIGTLEEIIGLDPIKAPVEMVTLDVMGKPLPLGIILGYYYGISALLRKLNVTHRKINRGAKLDLQSDEYVVRFKDLTLIMPRTELLASLIFSSLNAYKKSIANYDFSEFDNKDVYAAVLDSEGLGARYYRELDLLLALYIDPISEEILKSMNEPTYFPMLLIRAAELLTVDDHPDENDAHYRRFRGYERISGHVYSQIVQGLRYYKASGNNPKAKVDISPVAVRNAINQDPSVTIVDDINPIANIKEPENLTFGGTGGRTGRTLVKRTRAFHPTEMGLVDATVDSGDVGVTVFLTQNPKLKNLRGLAQDWEFDQTAVSSLVSTPALLMPGADGDDPKRRNFISIQLQHVVACEGYVPAPVGTGEEDIIALRTGDMFSFVAKGKGVISNVDHDSHVTITYNDPNIPDDIVEIGTRYGKSAGHIVAHKLVCDLPKGSKVNEGDVIVYNTGFFTRSIFDPTQVTWKNGVISRVAFMDTPDTLEDSIAVAPTLASKLKMIKADFKEITIRFDQTLRNLVREGDAIEVGSILCNIEDAITAQSSMLDDEIMNSLKTLEMRSPKSPMSGRVGKIDVIYHGDLDDMNDDLRTLVMSFDRARAKKAKMLGSEITSGEVSDLDMDTVKISIYFEGSLSAGDADKAVVCNQLKTEICRVMVGENNDQYGNPIDAIFGYSSVSDRIITSAEKIGTTNTLVVLANQRAALAFWKIMNKD